MGKRGEEIEQTISDYNLIVQDKGLIPTYECKLGRSIIDVTLTVNFRLKIDNWRVCRAYNGSDHNTIPYKITTDYTHIPPHRQYKTANWDKLTTYLSKTTIEMP